MHCFIQVYLSFWPIFLLGQTRFYHNLQKKIAVL